MKKMITILGPTASGKTPVAASLAARIGGEIISADSRQVYRRMDIGTGKDLADYIISPLAPHLSPQSIKYHLIDICEPGTKYNLFQYQQDFFDAYQDIRSRGAVPILCGGTGLYIEAVLKGYKLSPVPQNQELRNRLEGKSLYVPLLLVSFHPCFTYLATFLNNDALMWAFVMGAVLGTLRWYSEPSLKNIMKISLCIGLGMMTKLSAALIAPPVAMVFLVVLIRKRKTLWKKLVGQFAAFGAVCVPLGMWFPVRGLLRWGIPLTYVQELPQGMDQELHGMTFIERITDFRLIQFSNVFEDWMYHDEYGNEVSFNEHNPLIAILKNSVFSEFIREWDFDGMEYALPLCKALFWLGVILAAAAFAAMIYIFIRDRSMDTVQKLFFGSYYVLLVGNLYMMSAKYPLVCTMNFRYLMPTVVTGALFIGLFMKKKNNRYTDPAAVVSVTAFSALSALVYLLVGQAS